MRLLVNLIFGLLLLACDLVGPAKVKPIVKKGAPAAALSSQEDIDRVIALVPPDASWSNRKTSISLTVAGTCITGSFAVSVQVPAAGIQLVLNCNETSGEFSTALDLSTIADGPLTVSIGFLKNIVSTAPIYTLDRTVIKDTEDPAAFSIPATFAESNGAISFSAVDGAAVYRTTFSPLGGGTAVEPIESVVPIVSVSSLVEGTSYTVSVVAIDSAGNQTSASNTATFLKTDTLAPTKSSGLVLTGLAAESPAYLSAADRLINSVIVTAVVPSEASTVRYAIAPNATACSSAAGYGSAVPAANSSQITVDGTYKVCVELTDSAGNIGYSSSATTFVVDTAAPTKASGLILTGLAAESPAYLSAADRLINSAIVTAVGASEASTVRYAIAPNATACSSVAGYGSALPAANSNQITVDGTYKVCVELTDSPGNIGYSSSAVTFVVDTVIPTVNAGIDISGSSTSASSNAGASASGYSTLLWSNQSSGVGTITFSSTSLLTNTVVASANGTYTLRLTATDAAGNSAYDELILTWSGIGGGGGGGGSSYDLFVPYIEGGTAYVAKWSVSSSTTAAGSGSRASLASPAWASGAPNAATYMSIALNASSAIAVVYPSTYNSGGNSVLTSQKLDLSLSPIATHSPDASGGNMEIRSVDVAADANGKFNYFYSVGAWSGGAYTIRRSVDGAASSEFRTYNGTSGYGEVFARINSVDSAEVVAVKNSFLVSPVIAERVYSNGGSSETIYTCGISRLISAEIGNGDDVFVGTTCNPSGDFYITNNKSRSGGTAYTKVRGSVSTTNSDFLLSSSSDFHIMNNNDVSDLYYVNSTNAKVMYCPASDCTSPTTVYTASSGVLQTVRGVRAADGTVFIVASLKDTPKNKLIFLRKTGSTSFSAAATYDLAADNFDVKIGKRVAVRGVAGNSNWANQHTVFVTSGTHNGALSGLTPDALCQGYAFGARLPRAQSTKAIMGDHNLSVSSKFGTVFGGFYSNASTPIEIQTQSTFFSASVDPGPSVFYNESGVLMGETLVWTGARGEVAGSADCSSWADATSISSGSNVVVGNPVNAWLNPVMESTNSCSELRHIMCATK